ncbi:MAG: hypothetical protein R3F39_06375 [Myxococcota bacterium]
MARGHGFGTFGGVFTPSILTILGVIMYMRLPWIVGSAGLITAIGIIAAAHVISVTTGLSVASIATDKSVAAGGPYYIISRSLGLALGGTLGLALFTGLAFSISLYVIGFSESLLSWFDLPSDLGSIRICGTLTLLVLTIISFISTSLVIKTQYFILALIAASLIAIFAGTPPSVPAAVQLDPLPNAPSIAVLFGIFFPAVTGFTAGVNMSGDLRDPRTAIPRGTMAAILVGALVYLSLAAYLAWRVPADQLVGNPKILLEIALAPEAVIGGVWGATLSSALGSILGAPRILQALSLDRITPRLFARGHGRANEPRNALLLVYVIAQLGILIGELDVIAAIVSIFFIATYGFLNLSAAIERWASPDFHPEFRIPGAVSVLGTVTCVLIMIQLDIVATFGAAILLSGVFLYLKRRELTLETGDTWEGVWSSLVRAGLQRLSRGSQHRRNWRPNVLLFDREGGDLGRALRDLGAALVSHRGVLTAFDLTGGKHPPSPPADDEASVQGLFEKTLPAEDPWGTMANVARFHGFSGLRPNTVLLAWPAPNERRDGFPGLLDTLRREDLNALLFAFDRARASLDRTRVDVWVHPESHSLQVSVALVRFITAHDDWHRAMVRFLLVTDDPTRSDTLRTATTKTLAAARVDATVTVYDTTFGERDYAEWIRQESADASLAIVGLPGASTARIDEMAGDLDRVAARVGRVLFARPSSLFEEVSPLLRGAERAAAPEAEAPEFDGALLPDLALPEQRDVAAEVQRFAGDLERLAASLHERYLHHAYAHHAALADRVTALVTRTLGSLERAAGADRQRQRRLVAKAQGGLHFQAEKLLADFRAVDLPAQQAVLEHAVAWFHEEQDSLAAAAPTSVAVAWDAADWAADPADPAVLRRLKRRRRWAHRLRGRALPLQVALTPLQAWYLGHRGEELLSTAVRNFARRGYSLAAELGRHLAQARVSLGKLAERAREEGLDAAAVAAEEERVLTPLRELAAATQQRAERHRLALLVRTREIAGDYAQDLGRLDVARLVRRERRVPREASQIRADLGGASAAWAESQALVLSRLEQAAQLASLHHRLATMLTRTRAAVALRLKTGVARSVARVQLQLTELRQGLAAGELPRLEAATDLGEPMDVQRALDELAHEVATAAAELPEQVRTLGDGAVQELDEAPFEPVSAPEVPLRRLVQFLLESELVGRLQTELAPLPALEGAALRTAQDAVRLVTFELSALGAEAATEGGESSGDEGAADEARSRAMQVIDHGLARIDSALAAVRAAVPSLEARIEELLRQVAARTDSYVYTGSLDSLRKDLRLSDARPVLSKVGRFGRRLQAKWHDALEVLLYSRSAMTLAARRHRESGTAPATPVEGALAVTRAHTASDAVLQTLPFYYRQLFLGRAPVSRAYQVGREREVAEAARAIAAWRDGYGGALVVSGGGGSGKTSLCRTLAETHFPSGRVYHLVPPRGGSADPDELKAAFETALDAQGSYRELLGGLAPGSVVVVHDLEMWWERGATGRTALAELLDLVDRFGAHCLFMMTISTPARRFIDRLEPISERALAVVECGPLPAEVLKEIIMLRHRSTGLRFELGGRSEEALGDWRLARLFSAHFDASGGNVGAALHGWVAHIERVQGERLVVRRPQRHDLGVLRELSVGPLAILLQLVLHKQLSRARLERIASGGSDSARPAVGADLSTLLRMGLVVENQRGVLELSPAVQHLVLEHLGARGLLP